MKDNIIALPSNFKKDAHFQFQKKARRQVLLIDQRTSFSSVSDNCFRHCCFHTIPVISDLKPKTKQNKTKKININRALHYNEIYEYF